MVSGVQVRGADWEDGSVIFGLAWAMFQEAETLHEVDRWDPRQVNDAISQAIGTGSCLVLVGGDGRVHGFAAWLLASAYYSHTKVPMDRGVYVDRWARRRHPTGFLRLMRALEHQVRGAGHSFLELGVSTEDDPDVLERMASAYRALGFGLVGLRFRKDLDSSAGTRPVETPQKPEDG